MINDTTRGLGFDVIVYYVHRDLPTEHR